MANKIKLSGNNIVVLPDGTEIEISEGSAIPDRSNNYLDKIPDKRPYVVTVKRPSGHLVSLNAVGIQTNLKQLDGDMLIKYKKPVDLLEDPFFSELDFSDFRFILSDTGEVVGSLVKYGGKKSLASE
ncbi:hypothetical protein A2W54_01405 [Candidatus Giovannonibacteria bacterium RIFCSPHIGHO2_02_43_13]|uniref:Uncharacterized protein n=1 Tax=Candidatus Giovannonibacteria bacterium RIFCSPHIGHO2_02_43_13 TaxID=1798330 RepID=A0A1F5WUP9_9BACT|nr:MAG: hypothetical protein UW28_C0016G0013 [Parcubacteria group bacterium GW2011_GWA2_44_13]OGF71797.1 MAG: hypothetical protein A3E06_01490 [Candidatus Giovannonibacteria bacterium RIFCSPHIGHO2_12_FULL_44_42]OGF79370.1 MAG: hypothetical protein A2W54_01405 [Candidatus Giovannonibacteria bacterium RIFCSPHIGHO2_02_43_13]OGF89929.1 MAG: hypothetical protein A3I94_00860 [Candidatus Giovannonibacteria bacterium RIFCSPLOWO2_02_FULL_43_54]OGF97337.1 MAG: hypothetical protein A3H08_03110 [Candidatus